MIPVFIQEERQRFTKKKLIEMFCCDENNIDSILKRLKKSGVLKLAKSDGDQPDFSEQLDEDIEIDDVETGKEEYKFAFVGVIAIDDFVLKCYPKYLTDATDPEELKKKLKQVLEVLEKYDSKKNQIIRMFDDTADGSSSDMLAVMLFLLEDYFDNGVYTNTQDIIEINGSGEINWDKTINETFTLISNNRPYYPNLITKKRTNDEFDYFKRLHECVLTRCSKDLENADLLDLFGLTGVDISDEQLEDFGDTDYILYRISKELHVQYNTRKQFLLKTMYAYISHSKILDNQDYFFSMLGTNSFNLVWEKVCQDVMNDQLKKCLGALPIDLKGKYAELQKKRPETKLIDLIDTPQWVGVTPNGDSFMPLPENPRTQEKYSKNVLKPDLISIVKVGDKAEDKYQFIIFDAKYYTIQLEPDKPLSGQPGIGDITKQYLYELAYRPFIEAHDEITTVKNCFLMPTDEDKIIKKGLVKLDMLKNLGLQDIQIRLLPADKMYQKFLNNETLDISELKLWTDDQLREIEAGIPKKETPTNFV